MKRNMCIAMMAFGLLVIACSQPNQQNNPKPQPLTPLPPDNLSAVVYPLDSARIDTTCYDSVNRHHWNGVVPIKAYTIRAEDLLGALGIPAKYADSSITQYKHARVYLGFRKGKGFKLFIVPVLGADLSDSIPKGGIDVYLNKQGLPIPPDSLKFYSADDEYVLDLNAPCPNTCAETSGAIKK